MHVLGVVGYSDTGKTTLLEELAERLAERGRVATVKHLHEFDIDVEGKDTARHRAAGADRTYGIIDDGEWFATGSDRTLQGTLEDLAPEFDYALVEGFSRVPIPQVVVGDRDHAGEALATAPDADAIDVDEVIEALDGTEPFETLGSLVRRVKDDPAAERAGAIATFTGQVRAKDAPGDDRTEHLTFEKYKGVAEQRLADLERALESRDGVLSVELHHRTGTIEAGEDIVFVVVLAGHRTEAFEAVSDGIDRLKEDVPIFKKEITVEDSFWVHER
ncbi:Molybdopterin converting factor, large subunit [Halapricum desulfuricans]|uniref:Molybdopterin converting factor, large subunit n=1 Tax=Halapricum desulfuricans TaxID=2841257 RepID=A0A897NEN9_9EURY|nr:molybdopterin synthase [Halapricum desulfuricans]QSG10998.1 Molybdopterin converting factor, large subunit [Halapricum desulfuricans]